MRNCRLSNMYSFIPAPSTNPYDPTRSRLPAVADPDTRASPGRRLAIRILRRVSSDNFLSALKLESEMELRCSLDRRIALFQGLRPTCAADIRARVSGLSFLPLFQGIRPFIDSDNLSRMDWLFLFPSIV